MISFYKSTVGKKVVVALTGIILFGFVILHMLGNLKAFAGMDPSSGLYKLDLYAALLREIGAHFVGHGTVLWITRVVLLLAVILHVTTIIQLKLVMRRARPESYASQQFSSATYASRSMYIGGTLLFVFIVYHILHFTTGDLNFHGFEEGKVYLNVFRAFQSPAIVGAYGLAMLALGFHIYHGGWSLFQTLGLDSSGANPKIRALAFLAAVVVSIGFFSVPLAFFLGFLGAPH